MIRTNKSFGALGTLIVIPFLALVTVEATACGTPVIVFNRTAVPEVVTPECGVVCEKNDAASIFETLQNFGP